MAGLDCILDVIRALRMGSCLSSDRRSNPSSPASAGGKRHHHNRRGGRKKGRSRGALFDPSGKEEQQLHRVPGRMFLNGASEVASLFTLQGKKGINQDAMIVWENFGSRSDTIFCGVFDGHGPYGHMVSKRVRDILPLKLSSNWEVNIGNKESRFDTVSNSRSMNSDDTTTMSLEEEPMFSADFAEKERHSEIIRQLKDSFLEAFQNMDKELRANPNINCFCSGTTAVTLIKQGQELIIGNVGDSRAILGTRDQNESLVAVQLTMDLKPNLPREAERIKQCKGRVFALRDEPDVARVWLPNSNSPGLAMARAFGDFCLKDFGLISVPEITYWHITGRDEFIVLATDGVWDVLSNGEVINIVANAPRSTAARTLVESAVRAWRLRYPASKVDDCAVVCLFFDTDAYLNSFDLKIAEGNELLDDTRDNSDNQEPVPISFDHLGTVNGGNEILQDDITQSPEKHLSRPPSHQQSSDVDDAQMQNEDWSALEGVSRVNTLLTLPRYIAGRKQSTGMKSQKRA